MESGGRSHQTGQVVILFLFCTIGFVILLAFLLNSARLTGRKIEMQGAADAAALGGATVMARGMNLITLNNKGMADILSAMIVIRSMRNAADQMAEKILPAIIALLKLAAAFPPTSAAATFMLTQIYFEQAQYRRIRGTLKPIDEEFSDPATGTGWDRLRQLDRLNQQIKANLPTTAHAEAIRLAVANGAGRTAGKALLAAQASSQPIFPLGRGPSQYIAAAAGECGTRELKGAARTGLSLQCGLCYMTIYLAWIAYDAEVSRNVSALAQGKTKALIKKTRPPVNQPFEEEDFGKMEDDAGNNFQEILDRYNARPGAENLPPLSIGDIILGGSTLSWPGANAPKPMMLTGAPQPEPGAEIPDEPVDLARVWRHLQFLSIAKGDFTPGLGRSYFQEPGPPVWATYAQADVYNPTNWSMFNQNWRAKLVRATLLKAKSKEFLEAIEARIEVRRNTDFSFVNNH